MDCQPGEREGRMAPVRRRRQRRPDPQHRHRPSSVVATPTFSRADRESLIVGPATQDDRRRRSSGATRSEARSAPGQLPSTSANCAPTQPDGSSSWADAANRRASGQTTRWRHYANNDDWFDDTSDGPVTVEVTLTDGEKVPVRGRAWVICAPPDYTPHTQNVVTLYDVMLDAALEHDLPWLQSELGPRPTATDPVSFTHTSTRY